MNLAVIEGFIGKDAETKAVGDNTVTNFTVATQRSYKKENEWVNETTWHNIVKWNASEHLKKNIKKGLKVLVTGRIDNYSHTKEDGTKHYGSKVIADSVTLNAKLVSSNNGNESEFPEIDIQDIPQAVEGDLPF